MGRPLMGISVIVQLKNERLVISQEGPDMLRDAQPGQLSIFVSLPSASGGQLVADGG